MGNTLPETSIFTPENRPKLPQGKDPNSQASIIFGGAMLAVSLRE